jgi:L-alanine-DL-glutamate epimerase-like enolase superfamily enzyme
VIDGVIASPADAHGVNVAPHNYFGRLGDNISASFAAVIPNLRMMEVDAVAWKRDFYANPARIKDGTFVLYDRPGWGTDIVDSAVVARPPQR